MNKEPTNKRTNDYTINPPIKGPSGNSDIYNSPLNIMNGQFAIYKTVRILKLLCVGEIGSTHPEADYVEW